LNAPRAWIAVAEMDNLRDEGIACGEKPKQAGVDVTREALKVYEEAPYYTRIGRYACSIPLQLDGIR